MTKLYIPPVRHLDLVPRPHLFTRLDTGLHQGHKLTLVSAPAGFGKTTLLSTWLQHLEGIRIGWLTLDEGDNDLTRFLRYISAAFLSAVPDMRVPPVGGANASFESLFVPLINQLAVQSASVLLVLDDYHVLTNSVIDEALVFLVDNAPATLHLVITTRADPAFPLPRWRARRQLVEIRAADMRFTHSETVAFLQATLDLELDTRDIDTLDRCTEGWVTALQLAAVSLRGQQDVPAFIQAFSGSHRYILDYLVEEVLRQQSSEVRDFLRAYLNMEHPDLVPELHRRAAAWHVAAGLQDVAIHHALEAKIYDLAATLIGDAYPTMLQRGEVATLKRWVAALPVALRRNDPVLMLASVWTRVVTLDMDDLENDLSQLEQLVAAREDLSSEERAAVMGEILTIRASYVFPQGDMESTIKYAEAALAQLPEQEGGLRSVAAHNLANAYSFLGEMEAAGAAYVQTISAGRRAGNYFIAFSAMVNLGELYRLHGRWREAETLYREGLAWVEAHQAQPLDGLLHVGLGLVYWDRWELARARQHLELGLDRSRRIGAYVVEVMACSALARLTYYQDERDVARLWMEETLAVSQRLDYAEMAEFAELMDVQCRIIQGDREMLGHWLAHRQPLTYLSADIRALETQVVAHVRLVLGDVRGALADLARVREPAAEAGWTQRLVETLVLVAQAKDLLGERPAALSELEKSLDLSRPGQFVRPFVEAGTVLAPLLRHIAAGDLSSEQHAFIGTVLTALGVPQPASLAVAVPSLVEPLTEREIEVLRLLPTELSIAEIAEQLVISYHTARTHLKHIYDKLDVHSRYEAVSRAQELGIS